MYNSIDIANFFVEKAKEDGVDLTNMKLQKLVYISHGFYLALYDEPLLDEEAQAWDYGPVIPCIYHGFKRYGSGPILDYSSISKKSEIVDNPQAVELLNAIWESYGNLSAIQLSAITHKKSSPWSRVYKPNVKKKVISNNLIKEYYKKKIEKIKDKDRVEEVQVD